MHREGLFGTPNGCLLHSDCMRQRSGHTRRRRRRGHEYRGSFQRPHPRFALLSVIVEKVSGDQACSWVVVRIGRPANLLVVLDGARCMPPTTSIPLIHFHYSKFGRIGSDLQHNHALRPAARVKCRLWHAHDISPKVAALGRGIHTG